MNIYVLLLGWVVAYFVSERWDWLDERVSQGKVSPQMIRWILRWRHFMMNFGFLALLILFVDEKQLLPTSRWQLMVVILSLFSAAFFLGVKYKTFLMYFQEQSASQKSSAERRSRATSFFNFH